MSKLTQARLNELLRYDPHTGIVTWKKARGRVSAGSVAGCASGNGYTDIRVDGEQHRVHRVIFLLVFGRWPTLIDHINGNRSDNRIENLREVTQSENLRNACRWAHNNSGTAGVFWNADKQKWTARIKVHGKSIHLGHFANKSDAAHARKEAEAKFGFSARHGDDPKYPYRSEQGLALTVPEDRRAAA